ncbi:MAG: hypothetical protein MK212_11840 [Saprospiraceae bacterium]|nr:hypothetical protein [Saprospiraceae bacterium]
MRILILGLFLMFFLSCSPRQEMINKAYIKDIEETTLQTFDDRLLRHHHEELHNDFREIRIDPNSKIGDWMSTKITKISKIDLHRNLIHYRNMQTRMLQDTSAIGIWSPQKEDLDKHRLKDKSLGDIYKAVRSIEKELRTNGTALFDVLIRAKRERDPSNQAVLDELVQMRSRNQQSYLLDTTLSQLQWISRYWKDQSLGDMQMHVNTLERNLKVWKYGLLRDLKKHFNHRDFIREDFYVDRLAVHLLDAEHLDSTVLNVNLYRYPSEFRDFYLIYDKETIPTRKDGSFSLNQDLEKSIKDNKDTIPHIHGQFDDGQRFGRSRPISSNIDLEFLYK